LHGREGGRDGSKERERATKKGRRGITATSMKEWYFNAIIVTIKRQSIAISTFTRFQRILRKALVPHKTGLTSE
jgi:hypothetical protein